MTDQRFYKIAQNLTLGDLFHDIELELRVLPVTGAAPLASCQSQQISYFGGRDYTADLAQAAAGYCLCGAEDEPTVRAAGLIPLISSFARADFAKAISQLYTPIDFTPGDSLISDQAQIASTAKIMPGVIIGAGCKIGENVSLGAGTIIHPGCEIGEGTIIESGVTLLCAQIGKQCHIYHGAVIGGCGFGVAVSQEGPYDIPHIGRVIVQDHVSIGSNSTVDRGMLGDTIIERSAKIDNLCMVAHNCVIGSASMIAAHAGISGSVNIGKNVIMAGMVGLADHINIGDGAVLAGGSAHMRDVPPGEKWGGYPAKPLRQFMREASTLARLSQRKPKSKG